MCYNVINCCNTELLKFSVIVLLLTLYVFIVLYFLDIVCTKHISKYVLYKMDE